MNRADPVALLLLVVINERVDKAAVGASVIVVPRFCSELRPCSCWGRASMSQPWSGCETFSSRFRVSHLESRRRLCLTATLDESSLKQGRLEPADAPS